MFRQLKAIDNDKFIKTGSDKKVLDEELAKKVVARYGKFLF
jgi:hypothetical protein